MATPNPTDLTVAHIAEICEGRLAGPGNHAGRSVRIVAPLVDSPEDAVTWLADEKLLVHLQTCRAAAVIGSEALVGSFERGIVVDDPEWAVARVLEAFWTPPQRPDVGIHPSAVVAPSAALGDGVAIGAQAVVGEGCTLGDRTILHPGVSLGAGVQIGRDSVVHDRCVVYDHCRIGDRVTLHSGVVLGADGFGYIFRDGAHRKLMHLGTVEIEDDVEIGANTCVDRGKLGPTRIGRGSKIDNLVMIAHNVQVGPCCIITGQCALAGSAVLGPGVVMGGRSGLSHGVTVGAESRIASGAVAFKDFPANSEVMGMPAQDAKAERRVIARVRKLSRLLDKVAALEKRVAELERATDH
jgi:UDP-3-O-[3-hydroxymyristoyl] glucosamine N-acyltransferase